MELSRLIEELSDPAAYDEAVGSVDVRQTHISVVFLEGRSAYKVKKPLALGFLDYSTLEKRRHFCELEVRLNRRLAPEVYLGVVPITREGDRVRMGGKGEPIEWAVHMERLPERATLRAHLRRREVGEQQVERLARRIAEFHKGADGGAHISAVGRFEVVAKNALENFEQASSHAGTAISDAVFGRLKALTDDWLARLRPCLEDRARRGVPRDTHGDLRLDHVYLFPDRPPPSDLVIVDCIEFNERFRFADPVADMAFLVMDLTRHGRRDLAHVFARAYFEASADVEGRALLPFYTAYRAAVRGKVDGMKLSESEVPSAERADALARAQGHWLLALGTLEAASRRPCLVLIAGLPGTGKSTLARGLAARAHFCVVRSDTVRKELSCQTGGDSAPITFEQGIYTPEWNARTYGECLRRAEEHLFEGRRVIIDASFRAEEMRQQFLEAATQWGVPGLFMPCQTEPGEVRARLASRRDDASDANWSVYQQAAAIWQEPSPRTRSVTRAINTMGGPEAAIGQALEALRELGLQGT